MPPGLPPAARDLDRATLIQLLDAAAPAPLPARQAIALLQRLDETDPAVFGALAYRALTGVEPDAAPRPPSEVVPGFPPFASEVLLRAVAGSAERRPPPAALLIVLETVPVHSWPDVAEAVPADDANRTVLAPAPDESGIGAAADPRPDPAHRPAPVPEPAPTAADPAASRGMHEEFRDIVGAGFDVPRFEPLEGAGTGATQLVDRTDAGHGTRSGRGRKRKGGARRNRRSRRKPTAYTSKDDRQQTLLVVALLVVLIAVGALYTAFHDAGDSASDDAPQGAKRSIAQPFDVWR